MSGDDCSGRITENERPIPCEACRHAKTKCDLLRPRCGSCDKRDKSCVYIDARGARVRKFHHRSKNGCRHCKTRRIRCDEARPVCSNCVNRGTQRLCSYDPVHASMPRVGAAPNAPSQLQLYSAVGTAPMQQLAHPSLAVEFDVQSILVREPSSLSVFFPSVDQRHQFCHFFNETAPLLVVLPTPPKTNPWITHLSHLALGKAMGQDITHDAFRLALLSLATWDMGFKIQRALRSTTNAMYSISDDHRQACLTALQTVLALGLYRTDLATADLCVAASIALGVRDRLAGHADWKDAVAIGTTVIMHHGGPSVYISLNATAGRRFLVEQMACVELLGAFIDGVAPLLLQWDNEWLEVDRTKDMVDHLETVYGWDRPMLTLYARATLLVDEFRQIDLLKRQYRQTPYSQIQQAIESRRSDLTARAETFLKSTLSARSDTLATPHSPKVTISILEGIACVELFMFAIVLGKSVHQKEVQQRAETIMELCDESMLRGQYAGLLLPLTWAAACTPPSGKDRIMGLFAELQKRYHLDHGLMERMMHVEWSELTQVNMSEWETVMRNGQYYVPLF